MSAIVTTAPFESAADENGVMMSPTFALFDRITPSNGARISVKSTETRALRAFASAAPIAARALPTPAAARSWRALAVSTVAADTNPFAARSTLRLSCCAASRSSASACASAARAARTLASALSACASTSRLSRRAITSPAFTREPSATPSHSRRPVAFDAIAALRCATT